MPLAILLGFSLSYNNQNVSIQTTIYLRYTSSKSLTLEALLKFDSVVGVRGYGKDTIIILPVMDIII